jgi:hypothetical protein
MSIFWGRVGGFPWWPCRMASAAEREKLLASLSSQKTADRNKDKHCVVFLGSPLQKGWITDKSLLPFDADSFASKLTVKSLSVDQHYLEAMVEGCRVSRYGEWCSDIVSSE